MPGWHEATKEQQAAGTVQLLGLIQEQHPDRCRLFQQWKGMNWPVMVDSLNLLGVYVVPITLFIDEHGIIRNNRPRPSDLEAFLAAAYPAPEGTVAPQPLPDLDELLRSHRAARESGAAISAADLTHLGDAAFLWHQLRGSDDAQPFIHMAQHAFAEAVAEEPGNAQAHFRLGVALRARHESPLRQLDDFASAVEHWRTALTLEPNQYIWRRRIQQYGPRLDKPYSFYDWVHEARRDIESRGETPLPLGVEPSGAEFAAPARTVEAATDEFTHPDPDGRVTADDGLVVVATTVVPHTTSGQSSYRVHVTLRLDPGRTAHWNNEAEPLTAVLTLPPGWAADARHFIVPGPNSATSTEERRLEFEVRWQGEAAAPACVLHLRTLFNVCEDENGACLYRRQDVTISLPAAH